MRDVPHGGIMGKFSLEMLRGVSHIIENGAVSAPKSRGFGPHYPKFLIKVNKLLSM